MNTDFLIYKKINLIIAGVLLSIFIYSGFFAYTGLKHPIPSSHEMLTGQSSISTGLSRSFSEIMKLNFHEAKNLNRYGIRIFMFFLIQLCLRLFFAFTNFSKYYTAKQILTVDCIVSISMFVLYFEPFINDFISDF